MTIEEMFDARLDDLAKMRAGLVSYCVTFCVNVIRHIPLKDFEASLNALRDKLAKLRANTLLYKTDNKAEIEDVRTLIERLEPLVELRERI